MKLLIDMLSEIDSLPMHMPGHKRRTALAPYLEKLGAAFDITEIDGFDNLHNSSGIIKESMQRAAEKRGADRAFYLINGSTGGILAAISACVSAGEKVICARNCHKSVYNGIMLSGAEAVYIMPEKEYFGYGEITAETVETAVSENPDAKLLILTSPTYEGIVSDLTEICRIAHQRNIPVLVDAAHGAHFGYGFGFPESAVKCGADISVESVHKTMPSLTQTAVCYVKGHRVNYNAIAEKLSVFQSSSPSYLLLASIDGCINLAAERSAEIFSQWQTNLDAFYERVSDFGTLSVLGGGGFFDRDRSKIVITGGNGIRISEMLRKKGIECEMASPVHIVAMTGAGDTYQTMMKFADALSEVGADIEKKEPAPILCPDIPAQGMPAASAVHRRRCPIDYVHSIGKTAAECVFAYPPGIPLILPGEVISQQHIDAFVKYEASGIELTGDPEHNHGKILVVSY